MSAFRRILFVVAWLVVLPSSGYAQATLAGVVKDASGAVLPGVTVEASSPTLIEKTRTAVTDGTGQYRITELPPGIYALSFMLTGFSNMKREGVEVTGSGVIAINTEMRVGTLAETITVTGETPVVDTQTTRRQAVLSSDIINTLPATRSYGALLSCHSRSPSRRRSTCGAHDHAVHDVLHRQWRPRERRPHDDRRPQRRGVVQRRRRLHVHLRRGQHPGDAGPRVGRPGRSRERRPSGEPRAEIGRQHVQRFGVLSAARATGPRATTSTTTLEAVYGLDPARRRDQLLGRSAARAADPSSATGSGSSATCASTAP